MTTSFEHFPMKIANAFVPDQMISFTGDLDGGMYIYGPLEKPRMHGDITLDSVSVYARQAGARYGLTTVPCRLRIIN